MNNNIDEVLVCLLFFCSYYGTTTTGILLTELHTLVVLSECVLRIICLLAAILLHELTYLTQTELDDLANVHPITSLCFFDICFFYLLILRHHNNGNFIALEKHLFSVLCVCAPFFMKS